VLPLIGHFVEFSVHLLRGTPRLGISVAVSVGLTFISPLLNLVTLDAWACRRLD